MIETRAKLTFSLRPSGLERSEAGSCNNIRQKITDVAFPVGVSNEVRKATHTTGLEEAGSIALLKGNGEACVPGIQQAADFSAVPRASDLRILLRDGINSTPQEVQSLS